MKKPVYNLAIGDTFLADDGRWWKVDEVKKPDDWNSNIPIGSKPKNWEVLARTNGQTNRRFYMQGTKVVDCKEKDIT